MIQKREPFRVYNSLAESVDDYINFLQSNERYQNVLQSTNDVEQFLQGLQDAGYATDPNYATKISNIVSKVIGLTSR
jgi:flagellar protein FlgJ